MQRRQLRVLLHLVNAQGGFVSLSVRLRDYRAERLDLLQRGVRIERATLFLSGLGGVRHLPVYCPRRPEARGQGERSEP